MIRTKQIFRLKRYFIVVYMFQLKDGVTGQGQCSVITKRGRYVSTNEVIKNIEKEMESKMENFVLLNLIELNKRDLMTHRKSAQTIINGK